MRSKRGGDLKTALLVLVHGSPQESANDEMLRVVESIRSQGIYPIVEVGFLECNDPTIPDSIDTCVRLGAERIIGVPYFLHPGKHVARDVPDLFRAAREKHTAVEFRLSDMLGASPLVTEVLLDRASRH